MNERVDRETRAEYRLRLRAVDGGRPTPRTGTLEIVVVVLDSNDNRPVFTRDQYELTVVENSPVCRARAPAIIIIIIKIKSTNTQNWPAHTSFTHLP